MSQLKNKTTLNLILFFSIFALGAAYFIQYILGYKPCNLCLIERLPYISSIIIILLVLILKKFEKFIIFLLALTFISATLISFYHFEDLLKKLQKNTISCKDANFTFFGLSLATINTIISFILSVITFKLFLSYEKYK